MAAELKGGAHIKRDAFLNGCNNIDETVGAF